MSKLDYERVFNTLVKETGDYVTNNHLQCMVLGISGGIDSTVVAAICHEVSKNTGIPLIGRSLPIKNKSDEFDVSELVGEAFCDEFKVYRLEGSYQATLRDACIDSGDANDANFYFLDELEEMPSRTPIANGNLQARCRMQHLYDLAGRRKGIVMSTDNQTEYQLGFTTIHGSVGDYAPMKDLWKTEVYELAKWLKQHYTDIMSSHCGVEMSTFCERAIISISRSIALTPTDGLGISNSDLEQIGAKSYDEVDDILQTVLNFASVKIVAGKCLMYDKYGQDVVDKVWNRHLASEFKRKKAPIYIPRSKYE